jgi:hypothetical protein
MGFSTSVLGNRSISIFEYTVNLRKSFIFTFKNITLNDRKSRIPQIRGIKGKAVVVYCEVVYCEPLITKKVGYYRLSQGVNKMGLFLNFVSHL